MSKRNRQKTHAYEKIATPPPAGGLTLDAILNARRTRDAFSNAMARIGFGTPSMLEGTSYPTTRITRDYNLHNSLYRSNWIIRKVIDTIPNDMCKNWYTIKSQVAPDALDRYQKTERRTRTKAKIRDGLKWGRLYGGAAAVIMIEGHEEILDRPLDMDMVLPGSYKGLIVLDRWSGITPGPTVITDKNDPEYGLPEYYQITCQDGETFHVDHSRVLRFCGPDLPFWEKQAEMLWGCSEVEIIFDELKKRDNTSFNIANLVFLANLRVLKMNDLGQTLSLNNKQAQQDLFNTVQAQNWLMNNFGMYILDKTDEFDTKQYTFSGLNDIYESFMLDMAGATGIPCTKLFGRAPAGLNATGESDLQNYDDLITEKQDSQLSPVLDKLTPIIAVSEWGAIPDDWDYDYNPVSTPDEKEVADLVKNKSETIISVYDSGIISQRVALKELRQLKDTTGMFSNITDEDIDAADPTPAAQKTPLPSLSSLGADPIGGQSPFQPSAIDAAWREDEHKRDETGQFSEAGGGKGEKPNPEKNGKNKPARCPLVNASDIIKKKVIAGGETGTPIKAAERLSRQYGGEPNEWVKCRGESTVMQDGTPHRAEIHWVEHKSIGRKEMKVKRWLDES